MKKGDRVRVIKAGDIYNNFEGVIVDEIDEAFMVVAINSSPTGKKFFPHRVTCWGGELEVIEQ